MGPLIPESVPDISTIYARYLSIGLTKFAFYVENYLHITRQKSIEIVEMI